MKTKINVTPDYNNDYTTYTKTLVRDFGTPTEPSRANDNVSHGNGYSNNNKSLHKTVNNGQNKTRLNSNPCIKTKLHNDEGKSNKDIKQIIFSVLGNILLIDCSVVAVAFSVLLTLKGTSVYNPNTVWGLCICVCVIFNLMVVCDYVEK